MFELQNKILVEDFLLRDEAKITQYLVNFIKCRFNS